MTIGIVIQARMESTRLPGKVLAPLHAGQSILEIMIDRLTRNRLSLPVCIATPTTAANEAIVSLARKMNIGCHCGSPDDVLDRYLGATQRFGFDGVIRVCADNPLIDVAAIEKLAQRAADLKADYAGYVMSNGTPCIRTHLGLYGEYVSAAALERAAAAAPPGEHREHVTSYLYTNASMFRIVEVEAARRVADRFDIRLTVDTAEDFDVMRRLLDAWSMAHPRGLERIDISELINFIDARPRLLDIMKREIARTINRKVA